MFPVSANPRARTSKRGGRNRANARNTGTKYDAKPESPGMAFRTGGRTGPERHAGALGLRVVLRAGVPRMRPLSPAALRGARARIRGDGEHDDGGGVQWHDGGRQLSIRARRAAGRRAPGRVSRPARLAAAVSHGGAARDARDPRDDAGGRPVSDPSGHDPLARRAAAAAHGRRAPRAGCARMQRPGGAGTPHGAGGTVTRHRIGGRSLVEVGAQHAAPLRYRLVAILLLSAGATVRLSAQVPDTT